MVEIYNLRDGEKFVIAELGVGEIFGEMSMIDDAPRSATVTATEDTEVIVIQRSRIMQPLISANPMMNLIMRVVLTRFREAQHQLAGRKLDSGDINDSLEEIRSLAFNRINSERQMRDGLTAEQFEMHYQPIVSMESGQITGFEALMRLRKSEGKFVSPVEFIPLAEETGLIVELGRLAISDSLRDYKGLADAMATAYPGAPPPFMSINVSGMQLSDVSEINQMAGFIGRSGVDPACIKLEITETLMVENFSLAKEALEMLKVLGVSLAIDDFGTGYSSLSYLHQFPLDTLKIDRIFVINMDKNEGSRRIVHSIANLALALEMNIVAEGIEDAEQLSALRELGCQYGQGYHMSRPLPLEDLLVFVGKKPIWN
jgi:EAL domain-containing protein (putative c-di-GMP-specific phosphodiesterase class I)